MKRFFLLFILVFSFLPLFSLLPQQAFAEVCQCFCKSDSGAYEAGLSATDTDAQGQCTKSCAQDSRKGQFLGCFTQDQEQRFPENNSKCWTRSECVGEKEVDGDGTYQDSEWATKQARECEAGESYCYNPPQNVKLNVAIGELKEASGLAEYIGAMYKWLLYAASLLAVVMIMIGGLQYAMARGNSAGIEAAKKRIGGAVVGLMILIFANAATSIIDPRLTKLETLRVPKVKTVLFLDQNSSCEALLDANVVLTAQTGKCGNTATIKSLTEDGAGVAAQGGLKEGDECNFITCSNLADTCLDVGSGEYSCLGCADIYEGSENGIKPDVSQCSKFNETPINLKLKPNNHLLCSFDANYTNECLQVVYPGGNYALDCDRLRADADIKGYKNCDAYDLLYIGHESTRNGSSTNTEYKSIWGVKGYIMLDSSAAGITFDPLLDFDSFVNQIKGDSYEHNSCKVDICNFAPEGKVCYPQFNYYVQPSCETLDK